MLQACSGLCRWLQLFACFLPLIASNLDGELTLPPSGCLQGSVPEALDCDGNDSDHEREENEDQPEDLDKVGMAPLNDCS